MHQQFGLAGHVAGVDQVLHGGGRAVFGRDLQLHRVVQQAMGQGLDRPAEGRGEQQVLAPRRHQGQQAADVADEAHVEHAVGLIEHQDLNLIQVDGTLLLEVDQPARGCHQHVGSCLEPVDLGVDLDPTEHHIAAQVEKAAVGRHVLRHLGGQFAGGGEHQTAHHAIAGMAPMAEALQHRQGETGGLAGAGLGGCHHVPPLEHRGNALALDR